MGKNPASKSNGGPTGTLMVRLDRQSKEFLQRAAQLRRLSVSDYVRQVTIAQARKEVLAAEQADHPVLALSPDEQLRFWDALSAPPALTRRQKQLGAMMRGQS